MEDQHSAPLPEAPKQPLQSRRKFLSLHRRLCGKIFAPSSVFRNKTREGKAAACTDLVTWTLGNDAVPKHRIIYADPLSEGRQISKGQIVTVIRRLTAGFFKQNNDSYLNQDAVCVHDFNNIFYPVLFQGIIAAGGCFTGTNPAYTETELEHHFRKSRTKFVITSAAHIDRISIAAARCGIRESQIFVFDYDEMYAYVQRMNADNRPSRIDSAQQSVASSAESPSVAKQTGLRRCTELLEHGECDWQTMKSRQQSAAAPAALFSTSGTSGLPKIAVRTHANLIAEARAIKDLSTKSYEPVRLLCVPFFHAFASPLANIAAMREGITTYVMPRFIEADFLDAVERYQVTETALVPPIIVKWLAHQSERRRQQLESLRIIWSGGAPMDAHIQSRAINEMLRPDARIVQVWGLTECGWLTTFPYPERDDTGSVGRPLPGYKVRLVDDNDRRVRNGVGEVVAKSKSVMTSYLSDEAATAAAFTRNRWYRTGDIGEIRHGKIYIVDRKKELIKVRGWQVAPAELEAILLKHEHIVDAAVIGITVAHDSGEEVPEAHVVLADGVQLAAEGIKDFLLQYLSKYKVVDCRIVFRPTIPKSASGKILRKLLRDESNPTKADGGHEMVRN